MKKFDQAINDYDITIELTTSFFGRTYGERGEVYLELQNYLQAINDFNNAIKSIEGLPKDFPKSIREADCYNNRGFAHFKLKNYQNSINDFNKAIEIHKEPSYYYNRGLCYLKLRNHQQAIKDIRIAAGMGDNQAREYLKSIQENK